MEYQIEKSVWTEHDFDQMGWHDSTIYALGFEEDLESFQNSLLIDLDYIFQWIEPTPPSQYFSFQVAPCTLEFVDVHNLMIDIETGNLTLFEIEIDDLRIVEQPSLEDGTKTTSWSLDLHNGTITFEAKGFKQYVRKFPVHTKSQKLTLSERGGISLQRDEYRQTQQESHPFPTETDT